MELTIQALSIDATHSLDRNRFRAVIVNADVDLFLATTKLPRKAGRYGASIDDATINRSTDKRVFSYAISFWHSDGTDKQKLTPRGWNEPWENFAMIKPWLFEFSPPANETLRDDFRHQLNQ